MIRNVVKYGIMTYHHETQHEDLQLTLKHAFPTIAQV